MILAYATWLRRKTIQISKRFVDAGLLPFPSANIPPERCPIHLVLASSCLNRFSNSPDSNATLMHVYLSKMLFVES